MRIDGSPYLNQLPLDLSRLQVGQRLNVEILQNEPLEEGVISLGGRILKAKLEAQVQTGDRFIATVKELNAEGITLSRETLNPALKTQNLNNIPKEEIVLLLNRGFGLDPQVSKLADTFRQGLNPGTYAILASQNPKLQGFITLLKNIIPQWSQITDKDQPIKAFLNKLGLDHERIILENIRNNRFEQRLEEGQSVKLLLLKALADESLTHQERDQLKMLLDEITGQQLWAQSGDKKNAFFLMHFPIQDQEDIFYGVLAFEAARKGQKTDFNHCHIALEVETRHLDQVGVELRLFENRLFLVILNDHLTTLSPQIEEAMEDLKEAFSQTGIVLEHFTMKTFEEYPQFRKLITGEVSTGVDIEG